MKRHSLFSGGIGFAYARLLAGCVLVVLASASAQTPGISGYPIPTPGSIPQTITQGSDGSLWFVEFTGNNIGRISTSGLFAEFALPAGAGPEGITGGPDGNIWFTEIIANKVGRITPSGVITEFALPTAYAFPESIASGPDGNLWFTEVGAADQIGRITPSGMITEFQLPAINSSGSVHNNPIDIAEGPDGNLWFTHTCRIPNPQLPGN